MHTVICFPHTGFPKHLQLFLQIFRANVQRLSDEDELVIRAAQPFLLDKQLLIKLFSGAQTRIHDLNIHARLQAAEADHVSGQIIYFHRFPHVQNKYLAAPGIGSGQHDQIK